MPDINNTETLFTWLRTCPQIERACYFGADYIGENATQYGLMATPSTLRYFENILGEKELRQEQEQNFVFVARVPYGSDVQQNLDNSAFFQDVQRWIRRQNDLHNFPDWDCGVVTSIECMNTGAPAQTGPDAALYQFQLKVAYNVTN